MLPKLIRLTLVLAAVAAGAGVFGPHTQRVLCVDLALLLLASAFLLWRAQQALRGRLERRIAAAVPVRLLAEDAHREHVECRLAEIALLSDFESRLHRTGDLLRNELGAREVRVYTVERTDDRERLVERVGGPPGFSLPVAAALASDGPAARALITRCLWADLPRALVLPVFDGEGRVGALLELAELEIEIDAGALQHLLERATAAVAGASLSGSAPSDAAPVAAPVAACAATPAEAPFSMRAATAERSGGSAGVSFPGAVRA